MANLNVESLLEWLCNPNNEEEETCEEVKELYVRMMMQKNHHFIQIYPPSSFLPVLCNIFLNSRVKDEILVFVVYTIRNFLEISVESSDYIVSKEGLIIEICSRLAVTEINSNSTQDLAEECTRVLKLLLDYGFELNMGFDAGCLNHVTFYIFHNGSALSEDVLVSAVSIMVAVVSNIKFDHSSELCTKSLSRLLDHENPHVVNGALRCFAILTDKFTKSGTDPTPLAQHGLMNALLIKLSNVATPLHPESIKGSDNQSFNSSDTPSKNSESWGSVSIISTNGTLSHKSELFSSVSISTVIDLLIALCSGSSAFTHNLLRSNLPDAIEKALKGDERCILKCMHLMKLLLGLIFEGRKGTEGDPEMKPVYLKRMLPIICNTFQSTTLPSIRKYCLYLIRVMINNIQASLLTEICVLSSSGNLGSMLVEVISNVLNNKDDIENQSVVLPIIRDLVLKSKEIFWDYFDNYGIIVKVLELVTSGNLHIELAVDKRVSDFFYQDDRDEGADDYEYVKEIFLGQAYYWKNWCFCRSTDFLYIWSEAVAFELPKNSNGWFRYVLNRKLLTMYSSGSFENGTDSSENEEELFGKSFQEIIKIAERKAHAKEILSHPDCTKLVFGNWEISSHEQDEIKIFNSYESQVVSFTRNVRSFAFLTNRERKISFVAKSSLGTEFPVSWILERSGKKSMSEAKALNREDTCSPATTLVTTLINMPGISDEIRENVKDLYEEYSLKKDLCHENNEIITDLLAGKIVLDRITFCNRYRKTLVQIETEYAKSKMVDCLSSFKFLYEAMVFIFNAERKLLKEKLIEKHRSEKYKITVKTLKRKEFWRMIIAWSFFEKFAKLNISNEIIPEKSSLEDILNQMENETKLEVLQNIIANSININLQNFREDKEYYKTSNAFFNLCRFETTFTSEFDFEPVDINQLFSEITKLAKGLYDGFQMASEAIKEVTDLTTIQDQIEIITESITNKHDDIEDKSKELIQKCMNIIVKVDV